MGPLLLPQPSQLLCLQAQPHSHDPEPVGGTPLPQRQPQPARGGSGRTGPARGWPLHSVRGRVLRPACLDTPTTLSPALAPTRDRQSRPGGPTYPLPPNTRDSCWDGPPCLCIPARVVPHAGPSDHPPPTLLHGLPGRAGTATCSHLGPRVDSAWSPGPSQPVCVWLCV